MNSIWILIIALYIVLTHIVAKYIGAKRKIGYSKTVFWSLMISPIIMAFIARRFSEPIEQQ
jgi:Na+-driven multidrug efflux pump